VVSQEEIVRIRQKAREDGQRVVFTNGCFDILHRGHVEYLGAAKELGDMLIVGVNTDSSTKKIKGDKRPIVPLEDRMAVLASLGCVDYVTGFNDETPFELIELLVPDVLAKGGDWKIDEVVGKDTMEKVGGKVVIIDLLEGRSTRDIIGRIVEKYCRKP
jgi:D-beta-D-heptose 7-phosphate kinase/D-beta-D-heptose 1-phosphate adenosyltransferase